MIKMRKDLSSPGMLSTISSVFKQVPEPRQKHSKTIALSDCLMSGLAIFKLKFPSLLQFDNARETELIKHNLKTLFKIEQSPCDTYMRERLDEVAPTYLRAAFTKVFSKLQRGKSLETFQYIDNHYLLSVDGTGHFSSNDIHCDSCCVKHHTNGKVTYYHQMLGAVFVHPAHKEVIPIAPEPILKGDGASKNDCERNASKRLLCDFRREHPHLKTIVVEDGLASNGPHIKLLKSLELRFILGAKPKDHKFLFDWVSHSKTQHYEYIDAKGVKHEFEFINKVPLNETHFDEEVNFLHYRETQPNGKQQTFTWVSDLFLSEKTVFKIMRAGRARWKVENETFNTLKNQGYHFEHNFGHGKQYLSTVFSYLMMLAFLVDQVEALCCQLFAKAIETAKRKTYLWEKIRGKFTEYFIDSWQDLYQAIAYKTGNARLIVDTG